MNGQEAIGLYAGWGRLPVIFAEKAKAAGIPVVCVGVRGMADRAALEPLCQRFYWSRLAALDRPLRCFRRAGVKRIVLVGKIHKQRLFSAFGWLTLWPDLRALRFWYWNQRASNADDTLTLALFAEAEKDGLTIVPIFDLCPEVLVREGVLTKRAPTPREEADIDYGWHLAKEMGRLDVGQSVAVRERAVLAVEAIEGTDANIRRAGTLCRLGGFVVVKVAKPEQDMRFDVPTVGPSTIETMREAGAKLLAIEAEKTILLDEAETIRLADAAGICIIALKK